MGQILRVGFSHRGQCSVSPLRIASEVVYPYHAHSRLTYS